MSIIRPVLVVTLVASPVVTMAAQSGAPLTPGTRIRVTLNTTPPTTIVAAAWTRSGDTLHMQLWNLERGVLPMSLAGPEPGIPLNFVNSLEASRGVRSYWHVGAGIGTLAGFGVGLAMVRSEGSTGSIGSDLSRKFLETMGWTLGGAFVGGVIGNAFHSEKWEAVPLTRFEVVPVSMNRVNITVSLAL